MAWGSSVPSGTPRARLVNPLPPAASRLIRGLSPRRGAGGRGGRRQPTRIPAAVGKAAQLRHSHAVSACVGKSALLLRPPVAAACGKPSPERSAGLQGKMFRPPAPAHVRPPAPATCDSQPAHVCTHPPPSCCPYGEGLKGVLTAKQAAGAPLPLSMHTHTGHAHGACSRSSWTWVGLRHGARTALRLDVCAAVRGEGRIRSAGCNTPAHPPPSADQCRGFTASAAHGPFARAGRDEGEVRTGTHWVALHIGTAVHTHLQRPAAFLVLRP